MINLNNITTFNDANIAIFKEFNIENFFESEEDFSAYKNKENRNRDEYGDWQTDFKLALSICRHLKEEGVSPTIIVEPTCGVGNFIIASLMTFDTIKEIYAIELYKPYLNELKIKILQQMGDFISKDTHFNFIHKSIFDVDLNEIKEKHTNESILLIGNPPWVTNSKLSEINSINLPPKSNFKQNKGLEAITGKANFDISEYISYQILENFNGTNCYFAFLVKNSVAKNILYEQKDSKYPIVKFQQNNIDAKSEFNVSVAACLLEISFGLPITKQCIVKDYYSNKKIKRYGWIDNKFVSNIDEYLQSSFIDGISPLKWRSGVKHDCSKVMELKYNGEHYINGYDEIINIENDVLFPLIKSSDVMKGTVRKYVILTQKKINEDTTDFLEEHPKTKEYLLKYADKLDKRGSSIYTNRPRFSMFGIGDYTFSKYKIIISGMYKNFEFKLFDSVNNKTIIADDTCYLLGFENEQYALITLTILNNDIVQNFIKSLMFNDAKRVINKDLLMRIDLIKAAKYLKENSHVLEGYDIDMYLTFVESQKNE